MKETKGGERERRGKGVYERGNEDLLDCCVGKVHFVVILRSNGEDVSGKTA